MHSESRSALLRRPVKRFYFAAVLGALALLMASIAFAVHGLREPTRKSTRVRILSARLEQHRMVFGKYPEPERWIETLASTGLIGPDFLADARAALGVSGDAQPYLIVAHDRGSGHGTAHLASEPTVCENPEVFGWSGGWVGFNDYRAEYLTGEAFRAVVARASPAIGSGDP